MACLINLNDRLEDASTGGYFVYLGWAVGAEIDVDSEDSACHGITDLLDASDIENPYGTNPGQPINQVVHVPIDQDLGNGNNIDFENVNPGFYGFAYVVGDSDESGDLAPPECGDFTCFEIEVVDSPNMTAPTSDLTFCEASLPVDYDLTAEIGNYISGGEWAIGGNVGTINQSTGVITFTVPAVVGNFTVTYTLSVPGGFHTADEFCADCTQVISFTLTITAASVAGTATSLAVCN